MGPFCFTAYAVSPQYKAIIERNPFDPKRGQDQNPMAGGGISSEANELEKKYSVYGVILAGENKSAYIKPLKSDRRRDKETELRKITVGDLIDGWTVKDITGRGIVLASGKKQVLLRVFGSPKKERQIDRPVGIATPRPVSKRPVIKPVDQKRLKEAIERARNSKLRPRIYPPNQRNNPSVNPFLRALRRQKELQKKPD